MMVLAKRKGSRHWGRGWSGVERGGGWEVWMVMICREMIWTVVLIRYLGSNSHVL